MTDNPRQPPAQRRGARRAAALGRRARAREPARRACSSMVAERRRDHTTVRGALSGMRLRLGALAAAGAAAGAAVALALGGPGGAGAQPRRSCGADAAPGDPAGAERETTKARHVERRSRRRRIPLLGGPLRLALLGRARRRRGRAPRADGLLQRRSRAPRRLRDRRRPARAEPAGGRGAHWRDGTAYHLTHGAATHRS